MIPPLLTVSSPTTLKDAFELLADEEAKPLAGGQSLIPLLKLRIIRPSLLVDLGGIDSLRDSSSARLGALMTWRELAAATRQGSLAAMADAAACVGDRQVRNRGTLGGSLAHGDPSSDVAAAVLAADATITLSSDGGTREVQVDDFFLGPFTTALRKGELISSVSFADNNGSSAYASVADPASGYPLAGAAVYLTPDSCRIGITGVAGVPFRAHTAERAVSAEDDVARAVREDLREVNILSDERVPGDYRAHLVPIVVQRALERARQREVQT